jgi:hypothetical protein
LANGLDDRNDCYAGAERNFANYKSREALWNTTSWREADISWNQLDTRISNMLPKQPSRLAWSFIDPGGSYVEGNRELVSLR